MLCSILAVCMGWRYAMRGGGFPCAIGAVHVNHEWEKHGGAKTGLRSILPNFLSFHAWNSMYNTEWHQNCHYSNFIFFSLVVVFGLHRGVCVGFEVSLADLPSALTTPQEMGGGPYFAAYHVVQLHFLEPCGVPPLELPKYTPTCSLTHFETQNPKPKRQNVPNAFFFGKNAKTTRGLGVWCLHMAKLF